MSILNLAGLTLIGNTMSSFTSPDTRAFYSIAEGLVMTVSGNKFTCNITIDDSFTKRLLDNETYP